MLAPPNLYNTLHLPMPFFSFHPSPPLHYVLSVCLFFSLGRQASTDNRCRSTKTHTAPGSSQTQSERVLVHHSDGWPSRLMHKQASLVLSVVGLVRLGRDDASGVQALWSTGLGLPGWDCYRMCVQLDIRGNEGKENTALGDRREVEVAVVEVVTSWYQQVELNEWSGACHFLFLRCTGYPRMGGNFGNQPCNRDFGAEVQRLQYSIFRPERMGR